VAPVSIAAVGLEGILSEASSASSKRRTSFFFLISDFYFVYPQQEEEQTLKSKDTQFAAVKLPKCLEGPYKSFDRSTNSSRM